ncbi:MAG: KUP/HAK/KT family potassium transporter [Armatimonadota bacterium]
MKRIYKKIYDRLNVFSKPLGIVFGDIGTSPIYTLTAIFFFLKEPTPGNIFGVLSLIIWSLIIVVYIQYVFLAMNLSIRGEGGIIILREVLRKLLKSKRQIRIITILSFIGLSFLIGDGIITPAISILSAVEGIKLMPKFHNMPLSNVILISVVITFLIFFFQSKGTDKVAKFFSPVMGIWFLILGITGIISIIQFPSILGAVSPGHAFAFFAKNKLLGFLVLCEVILCVTGGEALYADMGHLGKNSIKRAWHFVFICLVLCYLGQGAHLMKNPGTKSMLFGMIHAQSVLFYIPFLILAICATVIASQAMLSAMFSIVYQAINTNILPRLRIDHTSKKMHSQIYIGSINWFLFICVTVMLLLFKESGRMAVAYGFSVNVTMVITGLMLLWIYSLKKEPLYAFLSLFVTVVDIAFLIANFHKIPHGGYISIILALIPLSVILLYTAGQNAVRKALKPVKSQAFLSEYNQVYESAPKITGTAIFISDDFANLPTYIPNVMFKQGIIYQENIGCEIKVTDKPFGLDVEFTEDIAPGLKALYIKLGYMEVINVEEILEKHSVNERIIFYGIEEIHTHDIFYKIFNIIKRLTPKVVQFYEFPPEKVHGVITLLDI